MALIFDDASLNGWQLRHLMPLYRTDGLHLLDLRCQSMPAVLALLRQDRLDLVHSFDGRQGPMRSAMAGLSARFPPALLSPASFPRFSPASPSEEGGLEEFVEFCLRSASWRSKSAICFSAFAICSSASAICCCC